MTDADDIRGRILDAARRDGHGQVEPERPGRPSYPPAEAPTLGPEMYRLWHNAVARSRQRQGIVAPPGHVGQVGSRSWWRAALPWLLLVPLLYHGASQFAYSLRHPELTNMQVFLRPLDAWLWR